jgi:hypothetical protein
MRLDSKHNLRGPYLTAYSDYDLARFCDAVDAIPNGVVEPIQDFARERGCDPDATLRRVAEAGLDWEHEDAAETLLDLLWDICPLRLPYITSSKASGYAPDALDTLAA